MRASRPWEGATARAFPRPQPKAEAHIVAKEDAACCMAKVDALGRPPIGFCGPDCERRKARDRAIAALEGA